MVTSLKCAPDLFMHSFKYETRHLVVTRHVASIYTTDWPCYLAAALLRTRKCFLGFSTYSNNKYDEHQGPKADIDAPEIVKDRSPFKQHPTLIP